MFDMIAYCGLDCSHCPTFLATRNDDDVARAKTAAFYAEKFGLDLKPEDIDCDGCKSQGGKLLGYCHACAIRRCSSGRGLDNCAACEDRPCPDLAAFHKFSPDAKKRFEELVALRGA
jgi:hypothetical protein